MVDDSGFHVLEDGRELHVYSHHMSSMFASFSYTSSDKNYINITRRNEKGLDPVADTDLARRFLMLGHWSAGKIPSDLYANGGDRIDLVWFSSSNISKGAYMCQFVGSAGHIQTTEVTVVNSSLAWCMTPMWRSSQGVVTVNVLYSADESLV